MTVDELSIQIKHSLAHLQDLIPIVADFIAYMLYTSQSRNLILYMC